VGRKSSAHPQVCSIFALTVAAKAEADAGRTYASRCMLSVEEEVGPMIVSADALARAVSAARSIIGVTALSVYRCLLANILTLSLWTRLDKLVSLPFSGPSWLPIPLFWWETICSYRH
jgi:hypothetical protein